MSSLRESLNSSVHCCDDLRRQNELLHAQVQSFSVQLRRAHQKVASSGSNASDVGGSEVGSQADSADEDAPSSRNYEDLVEILGHVRREKEMTDQRANLLQMEKRRLESDLEIRKSELEQVRKELLRLQESGSSIPLTTDEYETMKSRIEQVDMMFYSCSVVCVHPPFLSLWHTHTLYFSLLIFLYLCVVFDLAHRYLV